jgi:hypothetical protein
MSKVTSKFKELQESLPKVDKCIGIVLLLLNIFFPGLGTMICACIGGKFQVEHLIVGLIQLFTAACIIGWVWSIWWGVIILMKSG